MIGRQIPDVVVEVVDVVLTVEVVVWVVPLTEVVTPGLVVVDDWVVDVWPPEEAVAVVYLVFEVAPPLVAVLVET